MAAPRNRRHIIIPTPAHVESYTSHSQGGSSRNASVPEDRPAHGRSLITAIQHAVQQAHSRRADSSFTVHGAVPGLYLEFEGKPGSSLELASLENIPKGIELVAVTETQQVDSEPQSTQHAAVFVPEQHVNHFIDRFEKYSQPTPKKKGDRRHERMIDPIGEVRLAQLSDLWTDSPDMYPGDREVIWWEVWLRRNDGRELQRFVEYAELAGIQVSERRLEFDDRIIVVAHCSPMKLSSSIDILADIAEVRFAKEAATYFVDVDSEEQALWVHDLLGRITGPNPDSPAICVLDTGISRGHPLLECALSGNDCHAFDARWGSHDHSGHGTEMGGLALYGDIATLLASRFPVALKHRLESVKILPPSDKNSPDLYGAITATATSRVEIENPERPRCFSMAVTSTDDFHRGQPTSWSAAIDALSAGRWFDESQQGLIYISDRSQATRRLFLISAGNVSAPHISHLDRSDTEPVQDPGQAWNALTVGAYTEKAEIAGTLSSGLLPVAAAGELSPWSTTSVTFAESWPIKPDIVLEGGNVAHDGKSIIDTFHPDLCLLSTYYKPSLKSFVLTSATSAATAQAARLAAMVSAKYPSLWPETIRGLLVHSARWTPAMQSHLNGASSKSQRAMLVRRYGMGVPSANRALRSANDSLTMIKEGTIRPFSNGKMREIHFYEIPWPKASLENLGDQIVRLRVTLSYFIEPNPARTGWQSRHRYASHGLRLDLKAPTESADEFRKRLNKKSLGEGERRPASPSDSSKWFLGEKARNKGSLHTDILAETAADMAARGVVGIYPVTGWWKENRKRDRSSDGVRYSLIMSIETEAQDVDIWTPVAVQIGVPIQIEDD